MRKFFSLCFLLWLNPLNAQMPLLYIADTSQRIGNLKHNVQVFSDSSHSMRDAQVLSGNALFVALDSLKPSKKKLEEYWIRFRMTALQSFDNWQLLLLRNESQTAKNDYAGVYITDSAGSVITTFSTGALVPRSQKQLKGSAGYNIIPYSAAAGRTVTFYIKVRNFFGDEESFSYPLLLHPSVPINKLYGDTLLPVLWAIFMVFCVLSLFFFLFVKEKAYLFFALYAFVLSQHYVILHPAMPFVDFIIPEHPYLLPAVWALVSYGGLIVFCLFARYFLNLRSLSKTTDNYFRIFLTVWSIAVVIQITGLAFTQKYFLPELAMLIPPGLILLAFFTRFCFFPSILARLFMAGVVWLFVFTVTGILWNLKLISLPFIPWPIGQVGQLLIFSAALAYKVRLNEKARAEATRIKDMDEIKSKFFANISHEFRTPLTLIQGPLQQIEENSEKNDEAATVPLRHIKTMRRNTDRLLELVNQLLDLSKLDSGKMNLQIVKGDVLQLLKALTASYDSMAERKGIHYHVHFPEGTFIAFFDKDKLEKIVSNLLSNALKYTGEGGTVSVTVLVEANRLRVTVDDNGPGIPKKELDKIFDRFYQIEGTEDKGSGIGLALVRELVDLYRGQISVSSEAGKGSCFKVSLPIDKSSFKESELVYGEWKSREAFINTSIEEPESEKINNEITQSTLPLLLIVEDNAELRAFVKENLCQYYQIIEAVNGKEGLEKCIAELPDVVVSDVMMPVMDGFILTEKLKKDERTSHIPVILLTAKAGQQHKMVGLETGADDYLTKPFDAKELLIRTQNLINQRKLLRRKFAGEILLKPSEVAVHSADEVYLCKVMNAIEQNMSEEDFGVEELAKEVTMSRSQLHRKLVALTGQSPSEILRNTRLLRAKELLQKKSATPSEVAFKVGFNSHAYFSKCFKEEFGMSPSEV